MKISMFMKSNSWIIITYLLITIISIFYLFRGIHTSYHVTTYALDLTTSLVGTKNLIISGIDPYTKEGQKLIDLLYYGRELNASDLLTKPCFFYPLYIIIFYIPLVYVDMANAVFIVFIISYFLFIAAILLWTKYIFRMEKVWSAVVIIYFLLSPITYHTLITRQPIIILFFLITVSIYMLLYKINMYYYFLSGALLFLSTIKPQSSLLAIMYIYIVFLPIIEGRNLWVNVILGFAVMGFISFIMTNALVPGWISEFMHSLVEYRSYAQHVTGAEKLFGKGALSLSSWVFFSLVGLAMIIICNKNRRRSLHLICCSYLLILQALIFPSLSYALLMGIPIVALGMKQATLMWRQSRNNILFIIVFILVSIFYVMMSHWLFFLIRSVNYAKIINSYPFILKIFSVGTPFMILPLMLGLGIMLFIISYYSHTDNIDDFEIARSIKR
jgi:hypothetical protein